VIFEISQNLTKILKKAPDFSTGFKYLAAKCKGMFFQKVLPHLACSQVNLPVDCRHFRYITDQTRHFTSNSAIPPTWA
jgi:hypothetical protein